MNLPTKLGKVSVIEVVNEYKFNEAKNIEDLFLNIFGFLKIDGFEYIKLPVMELPAAIRENDPNLMYQPYYRIHKGKHSINIGPKVLSFSLQGYYSGWSEYKDFVLSNMETFKEVLETWSIDKISIRYIDFFENTDIFAGLKFSANLPHDICCDEDTVSSKILFHEINYRDGINVRINIANEAEVFQDISLGSQKGGIIYIDAFVANISNDISADIDNLHNKTKKIFFGLLDESFLSTLEPEYEEHKK